MQFSLWYFLIRLKLYWRMNIFMKWPYHFCLVTVFLVTALSILFGNCYYPNIKFGFDLKKIQKAVFFLLTINTSLSGIWNHCHRRLVSLSLCLDTFLSIFADEVIFSLYIMIGITQKMSTSNQLKIQIWKGRLQ